MTVANTDSQSDAAPGDDTHRAAALLSSVKFESKHYERGFDPPISGAGAPFDHPDYRTSVGVTTYSGGDTNTDLPYADGQDLSVNNHITVEFSSDTSAQGFALVPGSGSQNLISITSPTDLQNLSKSNQLTFQGLQQGTAAIYVYTKTDVANNNYSDPKATLTIDVMPIVHLTLGVWKVSDSRPNETGTLFPTPSQTVITGILQEMNRAFRPACVMFAPFNSATTNDLESVPYDHVFRLGVQPQPDQILNDSKDIDTGVYTELNVVQNAVYEAIQGETLPSCNVVIVHYLRPAYQWQDQRGDERGVTENDDNPTFSYVSQSPIHGSDRLPQGLALTASHEVGHQLGLSLASINPETNGHHDWGPTPVDEAGNRWRALMRDGNVDPGFLNYADWMRSVDWKEAHRIGASHAPQ